MSGRICDACAHARDTGDVLECRRYAPKPMQAVRPVTHAWAWPVVNRRDWCAEFRAAKGLDLPVPKPVEGTTVERG